MRGATTTSELENHPDFEAFCKVLVDEPIEELWDRGHAITWLQAEGLDAISLLIPDIPQQDWEDFVSSQFGT